MSETEFLKSIINVLRDLMEKSIQKQMDNVSRETETPKHNKNPRNTNDFHGLNSILDVAKERISEFKENQLRFPKWK